MSLSKQRNCDTLLASQGKTATFNTEQILCPRSEDEFFNRRTKIVCTLGPACWDVNTLVEMINSGMNIARFNFSHGDHEAQQKSLNNVLEAMRVTGRTVGLLLDTKGPEIRTGFFAEGKTITLEKGDKITLVTDYDLKGDKTRLACSYPMLPKSVKPGNTILIADGSLSLQVVEVKEKEVLCVAMNGATIGERKNMNLPGVKVQLPVCGSKEVDDVQQFCIPNNMNFIAASFVQCAEDVAAFRCCLGKHFNSVAVIPKIENVEGILNFDEILAAADGIMIARGDMGMEIPPEKVFLAQKMMIAKCNQAGKPVITATQMLESMVNAPRPTRAEASDVANAVLDGTDCVMLSGESANGKFPVNAVRTLARICLEAESCLDYRALCMAIHSAAVCPMSVTEAVCASAVETAYDTRASLIVCVTETGSTAALVAKYKPEQRILAVTCSSTTEAHLCAVRGVVPILVKQIKDNDAVTLEAVNAAKKMGLVSTGQIMVLVHGIVAGTSGSTNMVKVLSCP